MPEPAKCRHWLEKNFPDVFARMTVGKCHSRCISSTTPVFTHCTEQFFTITHFFFSINITFWIPPFVMFHFFTDSILLELLLDYIGHIKLDLICLLLHHSMKYILLQDFMIFLYFFLSYWPSGKCTQAGIRHGRSSPRRRGWGEKETEERYGIGC